MECGRTLFVTIGIYFDKIEHRINTDPKEHKIIFDDHHVIVDARGSSDNFFSNEIAEAVKKIENFLKPYLKI